MHFQDFDIQFLDAGEGRLSASVSSQGARATETLDAEALAGIAQLAPASAQHPASTTTWRTVRRRHRPSRPEPKEIGAQLLDLLLVGDIGKLFHRLLGSLVDRPDKALRILIRIDPDQERLRWLQRLPWEVLFDSTYRFLATSRSFSIVRVLDVARLFVPSAPKHELSCLALGASPHGTSTLNLQGELRIIEKALDGRDGIELIPKVRAPLHSVRELLLSRRIDMIHFMGHGWSNDKGEFGLLLEDEDARPVIVDSVRWADLVGDVAPHGGPSLVVLNACSTADVELENEEPFHGVAQALVAAGVPAVIAMSRPISDRASLEFSKALYQRLAAGDTIDSALVEARKALRFQQKVSYEWATPALYLQGTEGHLFTKGGATMPDAERAPRKLKSQSSRAPRKSGRVKIGTVSADGAVIAGAITSSSCSEVTGDVEIETVSGARPRITGVEERDESS